MTRQVQFAFRKPTPITLGVMVTFLVVFVASALVVRFSDAGAMLFTELSLRPAEVLQGKVWGLLTYAFLHDLGSPFHLLMNGLLLFFFGPELESRWGRGRYILFLVLTALGGGLFVMGAYALGLSSSAVVGASALAYGLVVAWGLTFPERELYFMFFLRMRGIHMVWLSVALTALDAISLSAVSASAHIGGMSTAALLVLGLWRKNRMKLWWDKLLVFLRIRKAPKLTLVPPPKDGKGKEYIH